MVTSVQNSQLIQTDKDFRDAYDMIYYSDVENDDKFESKRLMKLINLIIDYNKNRSQHVYDQYVMMRDDIESYGFEQSGNYNGVSYKMKRNQLGCWCGYIYFPDMEKYYRISDNIDVHGGVTYGPTDSCIGFDCSHSTDITTMSGLISSRSEYKNMTYKNYNFVVNVIEKAIDDYMSDNDDVTEEDADKPAAFG
jgi:hypothetical protein